MKLLSNTGVDEREAWRARIIRALQELRSESLLITVTRVHRDEKRDDGTRGGVAHTARACGSSVQLERCAARLGAR